MVAFCFKKLLVFHFWNWSLNNLKVWQKIISWIVKMAFYVSLAICEEKIVKKEFLLSFPAFEQKIGFWAKFFCLARNSQFGWLNYLPTVWTWTWEQRFLMIVQVFIKSIFWNVFGFWGAENVWFFRAKKIRQGCRKRKPKSTCSKEHFDEFLSFFSKSYIVSI